jgi:hypothetical protein
VARKVNTEIQGRGSEEGVKMEPDPVNINTLALKMEAIYTSETLVSTCSTKIGRHNPEDYNLNTQGCENNNLYLFVLLFCS